MYHDHQGYGHSHGTEPLYDHGVDHNGVFPGAGAGEANITLEVTITGNVPKAWRSGDLRRIVENVLKYGLEGLLVEATVTTRQVGGASIIRR